MAKCWVGTVGPFYGKVTCDTEASDNNDLVRFGDLTGGTIFNSKARVYFLTDTTLITAGFPQRLFFDRAAYDEDENYNTTMGVFTAPAVGYYFVTVKLAVNFTGIASACNYAAYIYKNGILYSGYGKVIPTGSTYISIQITDVLQLNLSDTISAYALQNDGVNRTIVGGPAYSFMTIIRLA